jgi:cell division protein FtsX
MPVTLALLLLIVMAQLIGMLHDVSSTLAKQSIAHSWRAPFDLFVRPQSSVSEPERSAGWIAPQSMLENAAGLSSQQLSVLADLPHVTDIIPYATVGWQSVEVTIPVSLREQGLYRITAIWDDQGASESPVTRYVEVSDLGSLTHDLMVNTPEVQHLVMPAKTTPVSFMMTVEGLQELIGAQPQQQSQLRQWLSESALTASGSHFSLQAERLTRDFSNLPVCLKRADCWQPAQIEQGAIGYQPAGVQFVRYTTTHYQTTAQQLADGQVAVAAIGQDTGGLLYRLPLSEHIAFPASDTNLALSGSSSGDSSAQLPTSVVPFDVPERSVQLPAAVRFISLDQACALNGKNCYSGAYLRLRGVDRYSQSSLALLQATAATITARTGLHVDILDGSSTRVIASSGVDGGQAPALPWRVTGVAIQIVHGLDALQETLLVLCIAVCLLAIGVAGAVIGIGRRDEAELLREIGWSPLLQLWTFVSDALILCLPGWLLSIGWIVVAGWLWPGSLPDFILWVLPVLGVVVYCFLLVGGVSAPATGRSKSFHLKVTLPLVSAAATTSAIFLMSIEYLLVSSFNRALVITVLGYQVRQTLEGPQLSLFLLVLLAALLVLGLCIKLILFGRRNELALLARVGWEWHFVLRRILWDNLRPALICGESGVVIALLVMVATGSPPGTLSSVALVLGGPILGALLVSSVTALPAWQEIKRAFSWK